MEPDKIGRTRTSYIHKGHESPSIQCIITMLSRWNTSMSTLFQCEIMLIEVFQYVMNNMKTLEHANIVSFLLVRANNIDGEVAYSSFIQHESRPTSICWACFAKWFLKYADVHNVWHAQEQAIGESLDLSVVHLDHSTLFTSSSEHTEVISIAHSSFLNNHFISHLFPYKLFHEGRFQLWGNIVGCTSALNWRRCLIQVSRYSWVRWFG